MDLAVPPGASDQWWANAVIYCLDVETYFDSNGDGVGDFEGLRQRLDYLQGLGVTALWLLPIFPTPNRDDGYDVADFYGVDGRFGSPGDFVAFRRAAEQRGMRVILDMVFNHTSDQHPWFLSARADRASPYHDYYVWADEPVKEAEELIFPGEQHANFTFEAAVGQYYFHRFFHFQPDLNYANPSVREEILKIMGYWLELGVAGFRLDAAPFLIETVGPNGPVGDRHYEWLRDLRAFAGRRRGDVALVAEANVPPDEVLHYFGDEAGGGMDLLFNFSISGAILVSLVRHSAASLTGYLEGLPPIPPGCSWLNFLHVHDELNLTRLSEDERREVFAALAPEERMRIYGRGLRRRLAPLFHGDRRLIELTHSLVFSLPGAPLLYYGDEIGMGDDLSLRGRLPVRTPMQWTAQRNAGFSSAPEELLVRPLVKDESFGFTHVNAAGQLKEPDSLLHWMQRLIGARKAHPEIGLGEWRLLRGLPEEVLGHQCRYRGRGVVLFHNLSEEHVEVPWGRVSGDQGTLLDEPGSVVFSDRTSRGPRHGSVGLAPYGYIWISVSGATGGI